MPLRLPAKRSKYGAKPVVVDGIRFHSTKEANRYLDLKLLEKAGQIQFLQLQRRVPLCAWRLGDPVEVGAYVADFSYCTHIGTAPCFWCVVEDVKGYDTPLSRWKRKHVEAQYGVKVRLV
jgi:hypothetical protein